MSVLLGLVFLVIIMGLGIRSKSRTAEIREASLSAIDQKTVVLKLR
jgi:hypothetical protein